MKKILLASFVFLFCVLITQAQTITSVANGNWTSPLTWGGAPPMPGATVVINHTVTLDMDWGYTTGSITINASGTLIGNSPMRAFAISGGAITNSGTFEVARVALYGGTATNNGTFTIDSLFDATTLVNNGNGTINADQFLIYTGGNFTNSGITVSSNFLNMATVTNNNHITSNDFMNSKTFTNAVGSVVTATFNFSNSDTLATPAVFTNNGQVAVYNDWANVVITSATVNGSGKFCIANNTFNSGTMSGTFDFCDQTGGVIDLNMGTVAGTITNCLFSCATGILESHMNEVGVFPNPANAILQIYAGELKDFSVSIFDATGNLIDKYSNVTQIDLTEFSGGLYFVNVSAENFSTTQKVQVLK